MKLLIDYSTPMLFFANKPGALSKVVLRVEVTI